VIVNPTENEVYVIDASTNEIAHTVPIADQPYNVSMSRAFAYIRALNSERVSMINLTELGKGAKVIVTTFAAGTKAPGKAKDLPLAQDIVSAVLEAAMLMVSPADATVYYYMEGMNAPKGAFRSYGSQPRAVTIANRALKEKAPGVYAGTAKIPAAGTFEVAFLNETPQFLHCFTFEAQPHPNLRADLKPVTIDYLVKERKVTAGDTVRLRFRLTNPATGEAKAGIKDVRVKYFRAPMYGLTEVPARHVGEGVYEATLPLKAVGAYYVYVAAPSLNVNYSDLRFMTLRAVRGKGS
jgi:YVTN family beta-propeller protein